MWTDFLSPMLLHQPLYSIIVQEAKKLHILLPQDDSFIGELKRVA